MNNRPSPQSLAVWSLLFLSAIVASAEVTVTGSTAVIGPRGAGADLSTTMPAWGLDGGNAVAVLFSAENASAISVTFGGEDLTVVGAFDDDRHYSAVAYLIDPAVTVGDLVIDATYSAGRLSYAYSVLSLAGVGSVAGSDTRANGNGGLSYTTTGDGGYVLAAAENNSFNYGTPIVVSGNPDTELVNQAVDGNCTVLHVHGEVTLAGNYTDTYTGSLESAATVAFESSGTTTAPTERVITSVSKSGDTVTVEFEGVPGETYDLNKSVTLDFSSLSSQDSVVLDGTGIGQLEDTNATEDEAFYRVEEQ